MVTYGDQVDWKWTGNGPEVKWKKSGSEPEVSGALELPSPNVIKGGQLHFRALYML